MTLRAARALATLAMLFGTVTVSCVITNEVNGSYEPTPTTAVPDMQSVPAAEEFEFGGVVASINSVRAIDQSRDEIPRLAVMMRSKNTTASLKRNPNIVLLCNESSLEGDWFDGSTWEPNGVLRVNAVDAGEVIIGFPLKDDNEEYPVITCTDPMLRITMTRPGSEDIDVYGFAVDPEIIAEAIRHPIGKALPLPASDS